MKALKTTQNRVKGTLPMSPDEDTAISRPRSVAPAPPPDSWWICPTDEIFTQRQRNRVIQAGWTSVRYGSLT